MEKEKIILLIALIIAVIFMLVQWQHFKEPREIMPLKGKIAFEGDEGDEWGICIMNTDGSNRTLFIPYARQPAISPDGKKIAFVKGFYVLGGTNPRASAAIYIMNVDGTGIWQVTPEGCNENPAWSPDGKKIAYQSAPFVEILPGHWGPGQWDIYVVDLETGKITRLTTEGGMEPCWSPDGKKIAFSSNREGEWYIYIMSADGSNVTKLTEGLEPSWSPDGKKIAFTKWVGERQIFTINIDGSNLTQLTHTPIPFTYQNAQPRWSPDGKKIAFASTRDGNWEIYVMNADGSDQKRLTFTPKHEQHPCWSPL